jgi:hypothetical protein
MVMNRSTLSLSHGSLICGMYLEDDKDLVILVQMTWKIFITASW